MCSDRLPLCFQDQSTDAAKAFLATAGSIDDHPFAITADDAVFAEYSVDGEKVVLFKKVSYPATAVTYNVLLSGVSKILYNSVVSGASQNGFLFVFSIDNFSFEVKVKFVCTSA